MPTLPLYTPNAVADASHRVTAPGGYEGWHFDAESAEGDVQLVAKLLDGCTHHPDYLRRYFRYRRRPTRVAPPLPGEYPCAHFAVYEHGNVLGRFTSQFAVGQFEASCAEPSVRLGSNQMKWGNAAGSLALTFELPDVAADLTFRPVLRHPPHERAFLSRALSSADHHWVVANPLCDVEGVVRLGGGPARKPREIPFRGRGYHDHHYGTGPIGPGLQAWARGRAMFDDHVYAFHLARPADPALQDEVCLLHCDANGFHDVSDEDATVAWSGRGPLLLPYPSEIAFGTRLRLSNPRLVDSSPFDLRLIYQAAARSGQMTTALCEVACPHRLRWPVVGRMVQRSIHRADGQPSNGEPVI